LHRHGLREHLLGQFVFGTHSAKHIVTGAIIYDLCSLDIESAARLHSKHFLLTLAVMRWCHPDLSADLRFFRMLRTYGSQPSKSTGGETLEAYKVALRMSLAAFGC
jgi:hypothetical protein